MPETGTNNTKEGIMAGIVSYGVHIPKFRLNREKFGEVWGSQAVRGEKAVANYDEDSCTMAVQSVIDCIGALPRNSIEGVFFATTTPNYPEKSGSNLIAAAVDFPHEARVADFTNSLTSGTNALASAIDAIKGGSSRNIIVTAADCRLGPAGSPSEQVFGDGAVAFLIGNENVIAEVNGMHSINEEVVNVWRSKDDIYVRTTEARFIYNHYINTMKAAINGLLKKHNLEVKDITRAIYNSPDPRSHNDLAKAMGFDPKTQVQDPLYTTIGDTGVATALMSLAAALENSKPGDKLLLANYGGGADAFLLTVTDEITKPAKRLGIKGNLEQRRELNSYEKFLVLQNRLVTDKARRPKEENANPVLMLRDRKAFLYLYASKCEECGTIQFPPQRVCVMCRTKDKRTDYRLSDKKGTIFTFSKDYISINPDPPTLVVVIDFEGGGRMVTRLTDCDPEDIQIGMPVEMTLRLFYNNDGILNYSWKARTSTSR
jgi:3-hydroxy-3-methylglutaryl CoA synthase